MKSPLPEKPCAKLKRKRMNFTLTQSQAKIIIGALDFVMQEPDVGDRNAALHAICADWSKRTNGRGLSLEEVLEIMTHRFGTQFVTLIQGKLLK